MSFVLFAGCKYFGIMIGDKRSSNVSGEIINDNATKVIKVNHNLVIGASGNGEISTLIFECFTKIKDIDFEDAIEFLRENYSLIYDRLLEIAKTQNAEIKGDVISNIGIMSCYNNVISYADIHIKNKNIEIARHYYPSVDDICFCYLADGLNELKKEFEKNFYKNPIFSITNIKSAFYKTLKENYKNDYTINDRFSMEYIARSDVYDEKRDRCK